jgi:N utilization substance protein B
MLNRRILRIKAFKTIYCYAENHGMTLKEAEALLDIACESTRDLYLFLLSIVPPLTEEARGRIESARAKFNPTQEELHPKLKFVENRIAQILSQDPDFNKLITRKKLSWDQYDVLLRRLYERLRARKYFKEYLDNGESSMEDDARLWVRIFEREFEDRDELAGILEDLSIHWNDDLGYALNWCCRSVRALGQGETWRLPPLYMSEVPGNEHLDNDHRFVVNLLRTAYVNFDDFCARVADLTPKWTRDRLCTTDLALIACGMAEARIAPEVSPRIIINEYVEISKYYSTPESSGFVNGLLDKLINQHN